MSAMASFCSKSYVDYLVDALSNTWTAQLGIAGYTIDCSGNYNPTAKGCVVRMVLHITFFATASCYGLDFNIFYEK